jgi:hypothetical protein
MSPTHDHPAESGPGHPHPAPPQPSSPALISDERVGVNGKIAVFITTVVGTMWTAYAFAALALLSLPAAIYSGDVIVIVAWIAQTFFQLVLLPVILVGQNVGARAADKRSVQVYRDTEAILLQTQQLHAHLDAQDKTITGLLKRLDRLLPPPPEPNNNATSHRR